MAVLHAVQGGRQLYGQASTLTGRPARAIWDASLPFLGRARVVACMGFVVSSIPLVGVPENGARVTVCASLGQGGQYSCRRKCVGGVNAKRAICRAMQ